MFKKVRNFVLYSLISSIILIAVVLSAARILLPDLKSSRAYIEKQLATVLDQPVKIGHLNAYISGLTPIVIFHDVELISDKSDKVLFEIEQIKIGFSILRSIRQQKLVPSIYTIDGAELAIIRQKDGKLLIQDIDVSDLSDAFSENDFSENTELSDWLFNRSSLVIQNSKIIWHDKIRLTKPTYFKDVTLRLKNNQNRHQFNGEFILSNSKSGTKKLELALDVYGDMLDPVKWVGKFYAQGINLNVTEWGIKPVIMDVIVEDGVLDFELWGDWIAGELNKIEADVSAYNVHIQRLKNKAKAHIPKISGLINWSKDYDDWDFSINKLNLKTDKGAWPETQVSVSNKRDNNNDSNTIDANVAYCRVEDVRDLLEKSGYVDNEILQYLKKSAPSGELKEIKYKVQKRKNKDDEFFLSAKVNNLSLTSYKQVPGLKNISGSIFSNHNSGVLDIKARDAEIFSKQFLPKPIKFETFDGSIQWVKKARSWKILSEELLVDNTDASLRLGFSLNIPNSEKSSFLDLQSTIIRAKASAFKNYLPNSIMKGGFKRWMDKAFVSGDVDNGGIIFNGRLSDFPFRKKDGVFKAFLPAKNITLDYFDNWPLVKEGDFDALITGFSTEVDVKSMNLLNSSADNFSIKIKDFSIPYFESKLLIKSNLDDAAQFASKTFLKTAKDFVQNSEFSGKTNLDVYMKIPLSDEAEKAAPLNIQAKAYLIDAELSTANNKLYAKKINGEVDLTKQSVTARNMKAMIMGGPAKVDVFTRHEYGGHPIRFIMSGNVDVSDTMKRFNLAGYDKVQGKTDWQGVFTLKHKQNGIDINPIFQATANMHDVIVDLPPPMNKSTKRTIPTYLTVENVSKKDMILKLIYGENMSYAMDMDLSTKNNTLLRRGHFRFEPGLAELPKENVLVVTGRLKDLSVGDWLEALDATSVKKKKSFFNVPVKVDMDYLHLAKAKDRKAKKPTDPRKLPTFEGTIADFNYDVYPYGKYSFKTVNEQGGMRLEKFTIQSPYVNANGKGYWHYKPSKQWTEVTMTVDSDNYGDLLSSLGFASIIENGVALFSGDFNWKGGFGDFRWGNLNGLVTMDINDGVFTKVDPGAGRLLGLLSIENLPGLLFSGDAFNKGFNFDRIVGVYEILDGNAYSDDVSISGPAANILVTGRTGIVDRDFDHYLTVVPNVSGSLTVPSTFVFGPQVGAVVYFFKKLFGSGIDESSKRIYHLTGTWKKPITTRIDTNDEEIPEENKAEEQPIEDESNDDS